MFLKCSVRVDDLQPFQFAEKLLSKAVSVKLNVVTPTSQTVQLAPSKNKKKDTKASPKFLGER